MNIVILDDYQDAVRKLACAAKLDAYPAKVYTNTVKGIGQLSVRLKDADVIVLIRERTQLSRQVIEKLPKLKLIVQTGRVGSHIDIAACTERGIAVAEGIGSPVAPAELTWALIMAAMRRIPHYVAHLKHGAWQQAGLKAASMPPNFGVGSVLKGKTLGIWSYGKIGQIIAGYGRAFGMRVVIWGRDGSRERAQADGFELAASKAELFEQSDVLTVHLRLHDETRGIVTLDDLSRMKPTALFVNTSRAELVEPEALIAALNRGRPGLAAVDVFESEPILQGHALLRLENCICTPHIGYVEQDSYELYFGAAFDNVVNFIKGTPTNIVNPGALQVRR
ncbi:MAG: 3-phosphoglycerate dehydrogenase [Polaromonas sp. 39-63-203]|jgi:D-3-phosphoglycerate dehydrogenase|uniref:D-2-hydroxyacid dehydrogenase family protein n=1 Tax=Polaromonas sp. TaxID=1869339 RepID=UPI000BC39FAD|nr:D-2-hydroxyacid dehydrogenase family protein [Polaromonas sp.]OYY53120.1 MAG: 3-phosphoglycerate dehydrogenase [Polaromonas sp. 35-63-240]OYY99517.1 MAG: 3-phosphoglycerate dehydrogenase [Polaromonas sp. 28-63-22]OYZ84131.1 MAG: 3-phosphoglycerate dehydrogenase [Polaromonas sp. 24-62-144]OZA99099.1 MAG: 3-phosphoglycerate dehydrogenase [Polaromonas sp. 39-63-203]HQS31319.1 D-2-hydroxyacid dehydrogenase family protein [Polaromonas sp.]